jgi:membrane-bound inhibitor of C-type lysozyme
MTPKELEELFEDDFRFSSAALIEHEGTRGIAIKLGESLCGPWYSGHIIVFWSNGDHTILPGEFKLIHSELFDAEEER